MQQVAAPGVDVNPFEPRLLGAYGRARELVDDLLDLGDRERPGYLIMEIVLRLHGHLGCRDGRPLK